MDEETFNEWLASYGRAWTNRDAEAAASLYTEDATYQVTPFDEPLRGHAAIRGYWTGVAKTQKRIQFGYEILAITDQYGIAKWSASFVIMPQSLDTQLDGIFLISLDPAGRCQSLREWWHKRQ
ncbi:MAG TPA: nuclear transport factor 2 family protein [Candidatus Methylomirabilis sp.]|nr:nuclear transport factor 2 family protein [Candidatus Methylomirabilis sp.]